MYRVVLDTNVIVSSAISEGKPRELLDRGIDTAYDGHADFVVTGDKALLRLKRFKKIRILSVSEAFNQI